MAEVRIRNIDDEAYKRLKMVCLEYGRGIEKTVRAIIEDTSIIRDYLKREVGGEGRGADGKGKEN